MKKLVAALISCAVLCLIYSRIDTGRMIEAFSQCRPGWLTLSLLMVLPTTLLTSWRLRIIAPAGIKMKLQEALSLTLAAAVLNMVLPSKMGDVAKACFIRDRDNSASAVALPLVIFEKTCDVLSLLAWCVLGLMMLPKDNWLFWPLTCTALVVLLFGIVLLGSRHFAAFFFRTGARISPAKIAGLLRKLEDAWNQMHSYFWNDKRRLAATVAVSLLIWFLHLLQIWMFIIALRGYCRFVDSMGLTALSIFTGLALPAFAGIGTRDAALIFFYHGILARETAAALGILCTARYVIPALGGLPFFARHLSAIRTKRPPQNPA